MEPFVDLFGTVVKKATRWMMVTNQRNLLYMLAAGLIMPPEGFGKKYYLDTLECFPGWIPIFADAVPKAAIEYSTKERTHLLPCILTLDISALRGRVAVLGPDQQPKAIQFPEELTGNESLILIAAPLPIHWITALVFRSKEERSSCEADAQDFGNVPIQDCKRTVSLRDFTETTEMPWPLPTMVLPEIKTCLEIPFAAGGMMALLFQLANAGDMSLQACKLSFDATGEVADPLVASLGAWMNTGHVPDNTDVSGRLFWSIVEQVAMNRFADPAMSARDIVLRHLESAGGPLGELGGRMQQALTKLVRDLRTLATFPDSTMTEILERHPKTFSRVMTLFFLHTKCKDLLE